MGVFFFFKYQISVVTLFTLLWAVRKFVPEKADSPRISLLAIFAGLTAVANPLALHFAGVRLFSYYGFGGSEFSSFTTGVASFVAGLAAIRKIKRSNGQSRGLPLAFLGIVGGGLWVVGWTYSFAQFALGMSAFH